ncbi:hypothetical protein EE612_043321, partial [Oryza sativa]
GGGRGKKQGHQGQEHRRLHIVLRHWLQQF